MKIAKIEDCGYKDTWDIEVNPQHHYLLSNGCVSHNTIGLIAGASQGIEPIYSVVTKRSQMSGALEGIELMEVYPLLKEAMVNKGIDLSLDNEEVLNLSINKFLGMNSNNKRIFITAHQIGYEWHIKMQAAFQKHTDNAVSKTINMVNSATVEDVRNAYLLAWELKCKGITIYRDGSRDKQVLTDPTGKKAPSKVEIQLRKPRKRPAVTTGVTKRINTGCGWLYCTVNSDKNGPIEVLLQLGKAGGCASAQLEAIGRLISTSLKNNVEIDKIIRQLRYIRCPSPRINEGLHVFSCADAIASVLAEVINGKPIKNFDDQNLPKYFSAANSDGQCPECGEVLTFQEGCLMCRICGFARC